MFHFFEQREKTLTSPHSRLAAAAAGVTAAAVALVAALVPPATHTAHADDAVAQTVEVSSYDDLKNVVERIGDNDRSGHTIVVKKDIAFDQMITLSKGQHITLVSDSATCAGTCRLTYSAPAIADHNFSLFNVYGDSSITIGTGAEDTDRLAFSGEANGRSCSSAPTRRA